MTASDPRVGEIQARLGKATPGPWDWDHGNIRRVLEGKGGEQVLSCAALLYPARDNAEFIAAAPADVAYLLAELADRDEKLAAVAVLAEAWRYKGEFGWGAWQEGHGPDQEGAILDDASRALRAAVAAANGGGE